MSNKKELSEKKGARYEQGVAAGAPPAVSHAGAEDGGGVARTLAGSGPSAGAAAATEGGANQGLHIVSGRPSTGKTALITAAAGAAVKKEPALYDEWLIAKKIGMRPRFVVRWRRERGKEGVDYERVRGCDEAGQAYERIGLTIHGARRAFSSLVFVSGSITDKNQMISTKNIDTIVIAQTYLILTLSGWRRISSIFLWIFILKILNSNS